jgi:hypothetical protein
MLGRTFKYFLYAAIGQLHNEVSDGQENRVIPSRRVFVIT